MAIDRTLAYTPYVRIAGAQHREIALTFDDGPGPYTPQVLSILEHRHVPATFFEVGVLERYFYASTARIAADRGCDRGSHGGPRTDVAAAGRQAASAATRAGRRDRAPRRTLPASVPPALRAVERHDAGPSSSLQDAHGAVDGGYQRLPASRRAGDRQGRRRRRPAGSDHPAARRGRRPIPDGGRAPADHHRAAAARLQAGDGAQVAAGQSATARAGHLAAVLGRVGGGDGGVSDVRRRRGSSSARARAGSAHRRGRAGCK